MKPLTLKTWILTGISLICLSFCGCSSEQQQGLEGSDGGAAAETEALCADGAAHRWGEATYQWINDHTACTATHTCAECGATEEETENAVLVTDESGNRFLEVTFQDPGFTARQEPAADVADVDAAFVVSDGEGSVGDAVKVTVSLKNNPGIVAAGLEIRYDRDQLELIKAEDRKLLADATFSKAYDDYPYIVTWNDALASENTVADGALVDLTFRIRDGATAGKTEVSLGYSPGNVFDVYLNNVTFRTVAGTVTVR